ncbi:hypothetical protein C8R43DRAFT_1141308 [Mycena crocata]|nr:hypothetical protein C8R43DRAFT_1141308 [Mycena crocata]
MSNYWRLHRRRFIQHIIKPTLIEHMNQNSDFPTRSSSSSALILKLNLIHARNTLWLNLDWTLITRYIEQDQIPGMSKPPEAIAALDFKAVACPGPYPGPRLRHLRPARRQCLPLLAALARYRTLRYACLVLAGALPLDAIRGVFVSVPGALSGVPSYNRHGTVSEPTAR